MADMGIGRLGNQEVVFKRKFRWTMEILWGGSKIDEYFVKVASRPNLSIEETEINFLNGKMWIPGKGSWETLSLTFYDVGGTGATSMATLYSWLATVYEFTNPTTLRQSSSVATYGATGTLRLFDGCGAEMEAWVLEGMWPQSVNFGDLDYATSDEVTIEMTMRFNKATYYPSCPGFEIVSRCGGCNTLVDASEGVKGTIFTK